MNDAFNDEKTKEPGNTLKRKRDNKELRRLGLMKDELKSLHMNKFTALSPITLKFK